jgi:hypothetical protein
MINHKSPKESKICDFLGKLLHKWLSTKGLQNSFCYEKIKMLKKMLDFVHFFSTFPNMKDNQPTTRLKNAKHLAVSNAISRNYILF